MHRFARSPRTRLAGRRGRRELDVDGIDDEGRRRKLRQNGDDDETAASREALLGEDVEDDGAHLLATAIWKWRPGTPAMERGGGS